MTDQPDPLSYDAVMPDVTADNVVPYRGFLIILVRLVCGNDKTFIRTIAGRTVEQRLGGTAFQDGQTTDLWHFQVFRGRQVFDDSDILDPTYFKTREAALAHAKDYVNELVERLPG